MPDQSPDALHDVAFALDHVIVEEPPDAIELGEVEIEIVGAAAIVTVVDWLAEPPVPVHVSV